MSNARPNRLTAAHSVKARAINLSFVALVVSAHILLSACAQELSPSDVTERFWRAVVTQHPAKVRRYIVEKDRALLEGSAAVLAISTYHLGRVMIDGDEASIETDVVLAGDTPIALKIDTRLMREKNAWRVDYSATIDEISVHSNLAHVINKIGDIGATLRDGVEQSVDEFTHALPAIEQELSRIEGEIKQHIPALRQQLESITQRIKDALEAPPKQPVAPPDEGTIAL